MIRDDGYIFLPDGSLAVTDDHIVVHGDCLDMLPKIRPESVDLIFADPPYFLSGKITIRSGKAVIRDNGAWDYFSTFDQMHEFNTRWISECVRVLRKGGCLWVSGTKHNIYSCGIILQQQKVLQIQNDVVYQKANAPPNLTKRTLVHSSEHVLWCVRRGAKYTFNYEEGKHGPGRGHQLKDVWRFSSRSTTGHPTQKPEALLERIILLTSKPGDLVVDPFSGSGTSVAVARRTGRRGIGIEKDTMYVDPSRKRIAGLAAGTKTRFDEHRKTLW